jgi:hypothetical protein
MSGAAQFGVFEAEIPRLVSKLFCGLFTKPQSGMKGSCCSACRYAITASRNVRIHQIDKFNLGLTARRIIRTHFLKSKPQAGIQSRGREVGYACRRWCGCRCLMSCTQL